ncbi:hypothetical protein A0H81_13975 [Grifola frondosa]|uniref:Altered inheritance of mitochondria protein 41 n=1 Tax=Grifola frondosa TaxID=5627 RepID=A0A1C7LTG1_GRIFR|nr:hypothetical protein A0H81_13975 [Grifola frondosa]
MFVVYRRNTCCAINALSRCAVARMSTDSPEDIRARLTSELKAAMKTKDTVKSTAIRVIRTLGGIAADKAKPQPASPSTIIAMIRKATQRRAKFEKAARPDLAVKEKQEAEIFQAFLPPLLPDSEIDRVLTEIISAQPASRVVQRMP